MSSSVESGIIVLEISQDLLVRCRNHAESTFPEECCGILFGAGQTHSRRVVRLVKSDNVAPKDRKRRYLVSPEVLAAALASAAQQGLELIGFYHSHPDGAATPSATDREAAWPDASYLIFALEQGRVVDERSWRLAEGGRFVEEPLRIEPPPVQDGETREENPE